MEFIANNLAPIMFAGLICFLLIGFPVAFSLGACGLFFAVIGIEMGVLPEALMQALPLRIYGVMQNETLLAIPFFTLMGLILERSGMAEDLLDTVGQLFGPIRGGVAIAVIVVGAMLAATTGVVAASVISMGLISLPIMMRYGYDQRLELHGSEGLLCAGNILENQVQHYGKQGCTSALPEHFFLQRYKSAYAAEWEHFVAVLRGEAVPDCSGDDGERALYLADKALESLRSQREIVL